MTRNASSPISSTPSSPSPPSASEILSAQLDSQIARLNSQISALRQQNQSLSNAILASTSVQNIVQSNKSSQNGSTNSAEDAMYLRLEKAVEKQQARNDIKVHRLINDVTTFPFIDPAPDRQQEGAMLGLRFELPFTLRSSDAQTNKHNRGKEDDTQVQRVYLVMLRRLQYRRKTYLQLQPEMNQIPKHIDVEGYAAQYLPVPDIDEDNDRDPSNPPENENFQDDSGIDVTQDLTQVINAMNGQQPGTSTTTTTNPTQPASAPLPPPVDMTDTNQNLNLFVTMTRDALLAWHYRISHITHIITSLSTSLPPRTTITTTLPSQSQSQSQYKHQITHIQSNPPATQLEIDWVNGTTGLLGITDKGFVGIARVFGPRLAGDDEEVQGYGDGTYRCHSVERVLEGCRLVDLVGRLGVVGGLMGG